MEPTTLLGLTVTFFLGLLVKDYFPGYARRKGENLATKEDIAGITREIETVKLTLDRQAELLSTKQELLMHFFDEVTTLHLEHLSVNFGDLPSDEGKSLFGYQQKFHESVAEVMKAYQRLLIFLPDQSPLLTTTERIANCTVAVRKVMLDRFGKVKYTLIEETQAYRSGDQEWFQRAANAADDANREFWDEIRPHSTELRNHYIALLRELNVYMTSESR